MVVANIFLGFILIAVGVIMLKFNFQLTNTVGRNNVFERRLGNGSTYVVMQLVSLLTILWGFFLIFGLHDNVLGWLLSPITGLFR
jgi:hypothetical protein